MLDRRAYTEAYIIICEMSEEMRNKIPKDVIRNIKNKMDKSYKFSLEGIDIDDYDKIKLLEDTEKILSVVYTDYFSTEEERNVILAKEKILEEKKKNERNKNIPRLKLVNLFGYKK